MIILVQYIKHNLQSLVMELLKLYETSSKIFLKFFLRKKHQ